MKDILLFVRDDAGQPGRMQAAIAVARLLGATISCIEVDETTDRAYNEPSRGSQMLEDVIRHQSQANHAKIDRLFNKQAIDHRWIAAEGSLVDRLSEQAAFHDLLIVNSQPMDDRWRDSSIVVSDFVRATNQPLLLVPDADVASDFAAHATIAWDGSRSCIAAMRAAVPLLSKTRRVTMVELGPHRGGPPIERGAEYLRRHGIAVHATHDESMHHPSEWLVSRCRPGRTSYCVMGAFGHSRAREAVFGGVTLAMLEEARIPLFVAH